MKAIVVIANGLRLDYLGGYGNEWIETPALDRLAAEGVVFDHHYSDRPDASGASLAWRTGHYHFPLPIIAREAPPPETTDLISILRDHGIDTRQAAGDDSLKWLASKPQGLLWLDFASLLPPWNVPEELCERYFEEEEALTFWPDPPCGPLSPSDDDAFLRLQRSYAAVVSNVDARFQLFLDKLEKRKLLDEVLLLVTTDRGLALGEHGFVGDYRPWLHEELVHLPLLVRLPGGTEAGRRVSALTQPVDLMPTLLDAFEVPLPAVPGRSLWPLLHGKAQTVRDYACTGLRIGDAAEWALRTPEWAFLLPLAGEVGDPPRSPQLYVKPDDRWEVNNVIQHHPELAEHLEKTLKERMKDEG